MITGEIAPPKGAGCDNLQRLISGVGSAVDAINFTDNQRGIARMSALGASVIARQMGYEPIVQMTCQNRNRLALQADALSASALGISNVLAMTGDPPKAGDHPDAKNVLDMNSFKLIAMLRRLRDEGCFEAGIPLRDNAPRFFVGGVANPNIEKVSRLERKVAAGAEFIQTQIIYDVDRFAAWMHDVRAAGVHQSAHIMAGVLIPRQARTLYHIRDNLPGTLVPDQMIHRMERAAYPESEGIALASELVQALLAIEGVAGIHLMSVGWTRAMPHVVERAGLLPRPPVPATDD